ncbi:hypothetical protein QVD17_31581 [Tagetes erecta]|uniref:Uncharacterized protein n=1 Tax=Tagetes erecta TaxID=13708 RepID=A0AAD8K3Q0_TARER|nr:hypothetical protein QVD17_31581 [Tagetes erecta]
MEEDNDLEQVTGSPSSGENEFVHVESVDSAQIEGALIDQVERLEQDDGVVVTGVDTVPDEPLVVRTHEEGGHDEFVDCPDDLVSSQAPSPAAESRTRLHPFRDDTEDNKNKVFEDENQITRQDEEEEGKVLLIKEVSKLHHQLKALSKQQALIDENDAGDSSEFTSRIEEGDEKSIMSLREMVNECAKFIELSLNERLHTEGIVRDLYATLHVKDKEIEDLMTRVNEQSISHDAQSIEVVVDRILSSLAIVFGDAELSDKSVSGKLSHIEINTSFLLQNYHTFLSEMQMLAHCLVEVNSDFQMENGMATVFPSVREELVALKRKEFEISEKNSLLEYQHGQLMEQLDKNRETIELLNAEIGKLKGEAEQEKVRYTNTKEKLSMAVTKGKALVQQRDSLKQLVAEKTSELERCLIELQDKSTALEVAELRNSELTQTVTFANSLQEALMQRDMVLGKCAEILSLGLPEVAQFPNLESQVSWLLESYNLAKDQSINLHGEINAMKEAASSQIDYLTASLLAESQDKYHLKEELEEMTCRYQEVVEEKNQMVGTSKSSLMDIEVLEKIQSLLYVIDLDSKINEQVLELELDERSCEIVKVSDEFRASKDEMNSVQINLQRSEEKASILREKLSMAVKKGKGLVQERENMKQQLAEKNTQIEALMADFQKQESTLSDYKDQIAKLDSERDHVGQFLAQRNMVLQEIIEIIDGISILSPVDLKEPVEKVKWFTACLSECQVAKAQAEHDLGDAKDEASKLARKLTEALTNMKPLEDALLVSEKNVSRLSEEKSELEVLKTQTEQEVEILKDEIGRLNDKLAETLNNLKSLEDKLAGSDKTISLLTEEKSELEIAKGHVEEELHKAMEEITSQASKFQEALSLAENNISMIMNEKEEAQMEVQKVKEEISCHAGNLDEAKRTIKSLEDAIFQLNTNVSRFSQENEKAEDSRTVLASEIKKLKEEAEQEILILKTELGTCRQALAAKNDKWTPQLVGFLSNLQGLLKDESMLFLFKQSFEKKVESLKEIDRLLKDMKDNLVSEELQDHPDIEVDFQSPPFLPAGFENDRNTDEFNAEDTEDIGSYVGTTLDNLNTKKQILANQFGNFSTLIDDIIASLIKKLDAIRNTVPFMVQQTISMQQNVKSMQMDKQMQDGKVVILENGIKVLVSVCADVTKDLKFHLENNMLQMDPAIGLEKSNSSHLAVDDVPVADVKAVADELLYTARNVQSVIEQHVSVKENMSTTIERLRDELEKTSSMYDKSKEVIRELQDELEESRSMYDKSKGVIEELHGELEKNVLVYEKVKEENDALQRRAFKFETELEASGNLYKEMHSKLEDYVAKEEKWNERERELSVQSISYVIDAEGDAENSLLSASQIKTLFDKIDGITIPFPVLAVGDIHPLDSNPVIKLFYIIDSVNELLDQLTLLTHAKEDMQSTLRKQAVEIDFLKGEFKDGLHNIIQRLGGEESVGFKKPADVAELLLVLDRLVQGIVLDSEKSRSKAYELSGRVKLLEDFIQNRVGAPDTIQKASSLPARSEISEIDDQVAVGKVGLPLVSSAAQMRSLRKGSNEQLAITIDSETERLLDKAATVEGKGHIFKSLHTTGLVPVQGKMIADRLDGIWVSGGQALMRRPRARLGLIAYWLVLHLWVLGTIL